MPEPFSLSAATIGAVVRAAGQLARLGVEKWQRDRAARGKLASLLYQVQTEVDANHRSVGAALNGSSVDGLSTAIYDLAIDALVPALAQDEWASILDPLQRSRSLITNGLQQRMQRFAVGEGDDAALKQLASFLGLASYEIDRWFEAHSIGRHGVALRDCEFRTEAELIGGLERAERSVIHTTWQRFRDALATDKAHEYTLRDEIGQPTVYVDPDPLHELELRENGQRLYPYHGFELIEGIFELWVEPSLRLLYCRREQYAILLDVVQLTDDEANSWTPKDYAVRAKCRAANLDRGPS